MKKIVATAPQRQILIIFPFSPTDHPDKTYTDGRCDAFAKECFGQGPIKKVFSIPYTDSLYATPDDQSVLITGSPRNVTEYKDGEEAKSVDMLKAFIKECAKFCIPMVGICYGLQIITEALGGTIARGPKQRIGIYPYKDLETNATFNVYCYHQDYIGKPAPNSEVILWAENKTPGLVVFYEDPGEDGPRSGALAGKPRVIAVTLQCHPEFTNPKDVMQRLAENKVADVDPDQEIHHKEIIALIRSLLPHHSRLIHTEVRKP